MHKLKTLCGLAAICVPATAFGQLAQFTFPDGGDAFQGPGGARMFDAGDGVSGDRNLAALEECDIVSGTLQVNTAQFLPNANCEATFELRFGGVNAGNITVLPNDNEVDFSFDLANGVGGPDFSVTLLLRDRLAVGCGFIELPFGVSGWECEDEFAEGENRRPLCNIGGPYNCAEGESIRLATEFSDPDEGPEDLEIGYDFDGDDDYGDAQGDDPNLDCALFDGPQDQVVRMRAWDGDKERICEADVTVTNVAPDVAEPWRPPLQAAQEQLFRYCLNAEDPSPLDVIEYELTTGPGAARIVQEDPAGETGCIEWTPQVADIEANPHEFCVRISDDDGGVSDRCWPVNVVENPNSPAAFAGEDQDVEPCAVRLCCAGVDPRGLPLNYEWSQVDGPAEIFFPDPNSECVDIAVNAVGDYTFQCTVDNGELTSPPDEVAVSVSNQPPTCDAGFDFRCFTEERCILDGRRSADPNNDPMFFRWVQTQPEDVRAVIPGFTNKIAGFFAPEPGVWCFTLECRDHELDAEPDEVCVTVNQKAKPAQREEDEDIFQDTVPVAHCGRTPQVVDAGDPVELDGRRSYDPDGNPINVAEWTLVSGPVPDVTIEGADERRANFTPPQEGVYVFALRVQDSPPADIPDGDSRWSMPCHTVIQALAADNHPPIADTGAGIAARKGAFALLDGTRSRDPDGDTITYHWNQVRGPRVNLLDAETATPSFAACTTGIYQFLLTVNDGRVDSPPAEVWATVHSECNLPPVANAGDDKEAQCVAPGNLNPADRVLLDGRQGFDPDPIAGKTSVKYQWLQIGGMPTDVELAFTQVAFFNPPLWDQYKFRLFMLDSWDDINEDPEACWEPAWSVPDDVYRVIHCDQNHLPVANAGEDAEWLVGDMVVLNGCDSIDGDGDDLLFKWRQTRGPALPAGWNDGTCQPTFEATEAETWCFELIVDDEWIESLPDEVCHNAIPNNNQPPIARCPSGRLTFSPGQQVLLDGAGSFDPNGDELAFRWTQTGGDAVAISAPDEALASFRAPQLAADETERDLQFLLTINDGRADDVTCSTTVTVKRPDIEAPCDQICPDTMVGEERCVCPQRCWEDDLELAALCGGGGEGGPPPVLCQEGQTRECSCGAGGAGFTECDTSGAFARWDPGCVCDGTGAGEGAGEGAGSGGGGGGSSGCFGMVAGAPDDRSTGSPALWLLGLMALLAWRRTS